jgi:hypothetical protein
MDSLKVTLLCDGSSDRVIIPIAEKLLDQYCRIGFEFEYAKNLPVKSKTLKQRIHASLELYPCDLLIIHRDAEGQAALRRQEIDSAVIDIGHPYVVAMPIKMTEAWLLCDHQAIRHAAGNPRGTMKLDIPLVGKIESCDAKKVLLNALKGAASGLAKNRLQKFHPEQHRHLIAEQLNNFTALRSLTSFDDFEKEIIAYCQSI